jgi:hypothetical protein
MNYKLKIIIKFKAIASNKDKILQILTQMIVLLFLISLIKYLALFYQIIKLVRSNNYYKYKKILRKYLLLIILVVMKMIYYLLKVYQTRKKIYI